MRHLQLIPLTSCAQVLNLPENLPDEAWSENHGVEEESHRRKLCGAKVWIVGKEYDLAAAHRFLPSEERFSEGALRFRPHKAGEPETGLVRVSRNIVATRADRKGIVRGDRCADIRIVAEA